jgi:uncharacterized protein YqeY
MAELKDDISKQIMAAMKAKDKIRLNVLRFLKKLFIENDTSGKPIPELDIVISHAKKIKDSYSMYPEGSTQRDDITAELAVLDEFLPKQLSQEEVTGFIADIKAKHDSPNMGMIMKELQPQIKGKFDGKLASDMVKAALA